MNSDSKILYIFSYALLVILSLLLFYSYSYLNIILAIILLIGGFVVFKLIKKRKGISINTKGILLIVSISAVTYLMGYYLLGIRFEFYKTSYPFNVNTIFVYLIPIAISIFAFEYIRYGLLSYENKMVNIITFLSGVILEILLVSSLTRITNFNQFMDMIALTIMPAVVSNILFTYLTKNYGAVPSIVYRSITTLYLYIIPFEPNVPESLFALMKLFVPLVVLFIVKIVYEKKEKVALKKKNTWAYILYAAVFAITLSSALIFSCQFKYGAVVIATDSMTGELNKGDIIFYEQYSGEEIKEEEIILFKEKESLIVHRVVEIKDINGEMRYYTKGDFNEDRDSGYRLKENIVGKTTIKCPYVGYITLWLREMFKK